MTAVSAMRSEAKAFEIPINMRAAVYRGVNDVRVETVPVPTIQAGELLIRIATCGICGTDLKKIHTGSHSAPRIFGHEMAGTVVGVGDGASQFSLGDRVVVYHHVPCGHCYYCRKRTPAQCVLYKKVGSTAGLEPSGGGFAEYIRVMDWIVSGGGVVRIPDGVPFEQAAFLEPMNTCFKGIKLLNLAADETVLVIGQGPIGLILAALAARSGAKVLTSDLYPERHAIAAGFGLKHSIDARSEDVQTRVLKETEERGADVVILAVGVNGLIRPAMDAARHGGKVMLFAQTQHGETVIDPGTVCMDEKTLLGSYSSSFEFADEVRDLVFNGYRNGFDLTRLISHRFALEDAIAAINVAAHPKADSMKIMIEAHPGAGAE